LREERGEENYRWVKRGAYDKEIDGKGREIRTGEDNREKELKLREGMTRAGWKRKKMRKVKRRGERKKKI
jgi:hypothetical protein